MATTTSTDTWKPTNWDTLGTTGQASWLTDNQSSLDQATRSNIVLNASPELFSALQASKTPTATTTPTQTTTDMINQQYQQSLAAKLAAAQKARDTAVNGYNQQAEALPGQYQPLRNQASLQGAQNSRAINEDMAAQGNWRSGSNQSAQTQNKSTTANAISGYNMQQQDAVNKLKQAIAQTQADYGYNEQSITNDNEAQRLAAQIAQANADKGYSLQQQQINNQASQFAQTYGLSERQFAQAITQQGIDNAYRDKVFEQQADQFAQQMDLSRDQFKEQLEQWAKQYELDEKIWRGYDYGDSSSSSSGGSSKNYTYGKDSSGNNIITGHVRDDGTKVTYI